MPQSEDKARDMPSSPWLLNAPEALISLHGKIRVGQDVLGKLLQDSCMKRAWNEINRRVSESVKSRTVSRTGAYQQLWRAIISAQSEACRLRPRDRVSDTALKKKHSIEIAQAAAQLDQLLRTDPSGRNPQVEKNDQTMQSGSRFDLLAHELFPEDVFQLTQFCTEAPNDLNCRLALGWTPFRNLLVELERRARVGAAEQPVVKKVTAEYTSNYFIRLMAEHFERQFGGPMEATIAAIATVVMGRDASMPLKTDDVKRALRHKKGVKKTGNK